MPVQFYNSSPNPRYLFYKIGGKVLKMYVKGYETVSIPINGYEDVMNLRDRNIMRILDEGLASNISALLLQEGVFFVVTETTNNLSVPFLASTNSLYFDKNEDDNFLSIPHNGSTTGLWSGNSYSISFWAKMEDPFNDYNYFFQKAPSSAQGGPVILWNNIAQGFSVTHRGASSNIKNSFVQIDRISTISDWFFLTMVVDQNADQIRVDVYGDGKKFTNTESIAGQSPLSNPNDIRVGNYRQYGSTQSMGGYIDELAFWNKALTPTETQSLYNQNRTANLTASTLSTSLDHWYRMGEDGDAGTTIVDSVGGVDGTLQNTMTVTNSVTAVTNTNSTPEDSLSIFTPLQENSWSSNTTSTQSNSQAINFTGDTSWVEIPNSALQFGSGGFTVTAWYRTDNISSSPFIRGFINSDHSASAGNCGISSIMQFSNNGIFTTSFRTNSDSSKFSSFDYYSTNESNNLSLLNSFSGWSFYAISYDTTENRVYTTNIGSAGERAFLFSDITPLSAETLNFDGNLLVGIQSGSTMRTFDGFIDEVAIWNRGLTPSEIDTVFNQGNISNLTGLTFNSALKAWYRMNDAEFPVIPDILGSYDAVASGLTSGDFTNSVND